MKTTTPAGWISQLANTAILFLLCLSSPAAADTALDRINCHGNCQEAEDVAFKTIGSVTVVSDPSEALVIYENTNDYVPDRSNFGTNGLSFTVTSAYTLSEVHIKFVYTKRSNLDTFQASWHLREDGIEKDCRTTASTLASLGLSYIPGIPTEISEESDVDLVFAGTECEVTPGTPYSVHYSGSNPADNPLMTAWVNASEHLMYLMVGDPTSPLLEPVVFVPGLEGSRLYSDPSLNDRIWETFNNATFDDLAMQDNGSPVNEMHVGDKDGDRGLIDTFEIAGIPVPNKDVYKSLIDQLNGMPDLVWDAVPYDWRKDISVEAVRLAQKVNELSALSPTGKVKIIAHSNGGLLTKEYLRNNGTSKVSAFVPVAVPHTGAPTTTQTLLHGEHDALTSFLGFVGLGQNIYRDIATRMHPTYQLLPSREYFGSSGSASPIIGPSDICGMNVPFVTQYQEFRDFLVELDPAVPTNFRSWPTVLSPEPLGEIGASFLDVADQRHMDLDSYEPDTPVYLIAGTGLETVVGFRYGFFLDIFPSFRFNAVACEESIALYETIFGTGDYTVPVQSATAMTSTREYLVALRDQKHVNIFAAPAVQFLIDKIVNDEPPASGTYNEGDIGLPAPVSVKASEKSPGARVLIRVFGRSEIHVWDQLGNHTGPTDDGDLEEAIPGSLYFDNGLVQSVWLDAPLSDYTVEIRVPDGAGMQPVTVALGYGDDGVVDTSLLYPTVAATPESPAYFEFPTVVDPMLVGDVDRDGDQDSSVGPIVGELIEVREHPVPVPTLSLLMVALLAGGLWVVVSRQLGSRGRR